MIEARIECVCAEYDIKDLGLSLVRGQVEWVSEAKAQRSHELKLAQRAGAVAVRWEQRCVVSKDKIPPYMRRRGKGAAPVVKPQRGVAPAIPGVDLGEVARVAREAAKQGALEAAQETAQEMRQAVVSEVQRALEGTRSTEGGLTREDVTAALQDVLSGLSLGAPAPAGVPRAVAAPRAAAVEVVEEDDPIFIPSKIGDDSSKAEIKVEGSEAVSSSSFDEAAAALKAAAPPRKKRRRKKAKPDAG